MVTSASAASTSAGRSTTHTPATRNRLKFAALITMTVIGIALTVAVLSPFLSALTWAFALAVVAHPLHRWMRRRISRPTIAAGVSVAIVTLLLFLPTVLVVWKVGQEARQGFNEVRQQLESGALRIQAAKIPLGEEIYDAVVTGASLPQAYQQQQNATGGSQQDGGAPRGGQQSGGEEQPAAQALAAAVPRATAWLQAALWAVVQALVALFVLFFLFRDREEILQSVRGYLPMSDREVDYFFKRVRDMTHATIYGNAVTALLQGTLGGIMFALLGIRGALLWGVMMALLSLVPSAGAFIIWLPAAAVLAMGGEWGKAIILAGWGTLVVGTIDNILYPILVGREVQLHTLAVFLSLVGGLIVFGAAGLVLGPVIAAATVAMLDILYARTGHDCSAVQPR